MTRFQKPKNGEELRNDNMVLGHVDDMTIVLADNGTICYVPGCDEEQAPIGTVLEDYAITPISGLSKTMQKKIQKHIDFDLELEV